MQMSDLSKLGIMGVTGPGANGMYSPSTGFDHGSAFKLMQLAKDNGVKYTPGLMDAAIKGQLVWGNIGQLSQPQPAVTPPPAQTPVTGYATLDPINRIQQNTQDVLKNNPSPYNYEYYRQAAMGNQQSWDRYAQSGGASMPYAMSQQMWSKYGAGLDPNNQLDNIHAYTNMTNDIYSTLHATLGRQPTAAEVYAASSHGMDAFMQDQTIAQQYHHLFV